jgi:hypothetical protein
LGHPGLRPAPGKSIRPYLKNKLRKKKREYSSSGRVRGPEFNLQCKKINKRKKKKIYI